MAFSVLPIQQDEIRPFLRVRIEAEYFKFCQMLLVKEIALHDLDASASLEQFTLSLTSCHMPVGGQIESEPEVLSDTTHLKTYLPKVRIGTVIKYHASVPPILWQ
jgi:hypothetical protein